MFRSSAAALIALIWLAGSAHSQDNMPKFDGNITLKALTGGTCPLLPVAVGQQLNAIYRVKVTTKSAPEVLQIHVPKGVIWAVADKNGDKTFRNAGSKVTGTLIFDTVISPIPDGTTTNLTSSPGNPSESTDQIVLTGTFKNFLISNCTARIRAVFNKR